MSFLGRDACNLLDSRNDRLELKRDIGNEQSLNALLQVYKNYYPDIIVGEAGPFKSGLFSVGHCQSVCGRIALILP